VNATLLLAVIWLLAAIGVALFLLLTRRK